MERPKPIRPERIRKIKNSFSWVDHDFINAGIIDALKKEEILLYYFLVSVGDSRGMSFYRREKICEKLKIGIEQYEEAKRALIEYDLVAYRPFNKYSLSGFFQVLSLPETAAQKERVDELIKNTNFPDTSA